ncbi:MAG: carboxylating nicotinate-nucleotide diphosphorylase [Alphaproteobacteria bacterium]|nr:carboxylating nicotinate-nucleotide diphosphorylase [Alphaproteobacteria bacterium]
MKYLSALPDVMIEDDVRAALLEDLGRAGDITSQILVPHDKMWNAALVARGAGVLAGLDLVRLVFHLMDVTVHFDACRQDGDDIVAGDIIAHVSGNARALLAAERTALNFVSHLSGIATVTRRFVDAVKPYPVAISCTRKTTPRLRKLEKYAVRAGGGRNHRFGLDDAVMIKDNHIAVTGDLCAAIRCVREAVGHTVKVEVEVDTIEQLRQILTSSADIVLLDNMKIPELRACVSLAKGRFILEASGGVTLATVRDIAETGVDVISVGSITHSAAILDFGLDDAV